ncbi:fibronectin type III domain-containing protein [Aquimarina hainanensis]|uniref:Fibronectin type III domain-containing protein n=1 Tax=Aquimarina hainanensis TaxID=1578017 RepID=A0ABW5N455_9FLAO
MITKKNVLLAFLLFSIFVTAQDKADREQIKQQTNVQALQKIIEQSERQLKNNFTKATKQKIPLSRTNKDGALGVLYSFDKQGNPVYAYDDNVDAAISCRANKIWRGGSTGLNLTGSGIEIGVWESGAASPTHQELRGSTSNGDGALPTNHGTHTGGTLIAKGIVPAARGFASEATLKSYTATGMVAEAASFAAAGGILANNSNSPIGPYGLYDDNARDMDNVAYNAPFYLHCKSAGNNGGRYGSIYGNQLAKNLFVVANANDVPNYTGPTSVTMASSSTYGPPKDWRVKPDITNNGVDVYSSDAISDTSYSSKTGTSMSTPATAGTVALLQQYYKSKNGVYMKAATAKALVIGTADEIGAHDGPDFRGGWGLVNAERAAAVITNNGAAAVIEETRLRSGGTYTRSITSDGRTPLAVTVVWNDPAGTPTSGNALALVNDLDLRVIGGNNTYFPWVMVPNATYDNYTDPAQKGDNFRDNVEKIDAVLPAGTYRIEVTHKGTLSNNSQDFSLVINGIKTNPDTIPPTPPTNVTAVGVYSTTIALSWNAATDNIGVTSYEIFQDGVRVGTSTDTAYTVTGLRSLTTYRFYVKAKDGAGNVSTNSNTVSVTTVATPACTGVTSFPYTESFETDFGVWVNATTDDIQWTRDSGGTPSTGTGPSSGQQGAYYIYTEASTNVSPVGSPNKVAILDSPCIDLKGTADYSMEFGYHMKGTAMGTMELLVSTDNGVTYSSLWSKTGTQGSNWNQARVSLSPYAGSVIKLRIKGVTGSGWSSDMALDNLRILEMVPDNESPTPPTAVMASSVSSNSILLSWTASTDNVGVTGYDIFQDGVKVGTSASSSYQVVGLSPTTAYRFYVRATDAAGNISGNSNVVNVTTTASPSCSGVSVFPYTESFETGLGMWTNELGDDIQWTRDSGGTPSFGTGPSSGQQGAYYLYTEASSNTTPVGNPNKVALLTSDCIDLSAGSNYSLEFGYHMRGNAMGKMEVLLSTDDGNTYTSIWSRSGSQGSNWNQAVVALSNYAGTVIKLQIKGVTGNSWSSDMAIDHIKIISTAKGNTQKDSFDDAFTEKKEGNEFTGLILYPNPVSSSVVHLYYPQYDEKVKTIFIVRDVLGNTIEKVKLYSYKMDYSVKYLPAGMYFVSVVTPEKTINKTFVKK